MQEAEMGQTVKGWEKTEKDIKHMRIWRETVLVGGEYGIP